MYIIIIASSGPHNGREKTTSGQMYAFYFLLHNAVYLEYLAFCWIIEALNSLQIQTGPGHPPAHAQDHPGRKRQIIPFSKDSCGPSTQK